MKRNIVESYSIEEAFKALDSAEVLTEADAKIPQAIRNATRAIKDTDWVLAFFTLSGVPSSFLSNSNNLTKDINEAKFYSTKMWAEDDIYLMHDMPMPVLDSDRCSAIQVSDAKKLMADEAARKAAKKRGIKTKTTSAAMSMEEAFRALNHSAKRCSKLKEEFENVATYKYSYISNTGDEYEEFMTDEEIDKAYATNNFTDEMWLEGEAFITKENGTYQVSWGEFDDYHEASSIEKCKNIVKKFHPNGFKWILNADKSQDVTEALTSSWLDIQNQIALEHKDGINPFYDDSTAGNYILELMGKVETELDVSVLPSVQGGYGDVYIHLGDTYANNQESVGPFNFTEFSNEMIDLILEADTEEAFINAYREDILAYIK